MKKLRPKIPVKLPAKITKLKRPELDLQKRVDKAHKTLHRKSRQHTTRNFVTRTESIRNIDARRFIFTWGVKFMLLAVAVGVSFYGTYASGKFDGFRAGGRVVVGIEDSNQSLNLNPLTLSTPAETAIGRLIYSSILKYDQKGKLQGDLAESYKLEEGGAKIRIKIKEDARWHDGTKVTAADVVFTFEKLKNPRLNNSLRESFNGVTTEQVDERTILVTVPKIVASFDDAMTRIRIAPAHLFRGISDDQLAKVNYNRLPVGSGSMEVSSDLTSGQVSTLGISGGNYQQLSLAINDDYYSNLAYSELAIRVFENTDVLREAFKKELIQLYIGSESSVGPTGSTKEESAKLSAGAFAFFNLDSVQLKEVKIRRALSSVINREEVNKLASGGGALESPILGVAQEPSAILTTEQARALIAESGYTFDPATNLFVKDGLPLTISLVTGGSDDYSRVAAKLKDLWTNIGVKVDVVNATEADLQSNYFINRSYDVLVYGISLSAATDPYAYWSSDSAKASGLNFSNYKSSASDADLDVARTKVDDAQRNSRLDRFAKRWREDAPAAALYTLSIKLAYDPSSVQVELNPATPIGSYSDSFDLLTKLKADKRKLNPTL